MLTVNLNIFMHKNELNLNENDYSNLEEWYKILNVELINFCFIEDTSHFKKFLYNIL